MNVVFETSIFSGNPIFLIAPPTFLLVTYVSLRLYYKKSILACLKSLPIKNLLGIVFISLLSLYSIFVEIMAYKNVIIAYQEGNYMVIGGEIADYTPPRTRLNPYESFRVANMVFEYGDGVCRNYFGYDKTSINGGAILKDGLEVKICYIPFDKRNVIVRLEIEKDK